MSKVTLLAVDLAKDVFQVAGFTEQLKVVFNKQGAKRGQVLYLAHSIYFGAVNVWRDPYE